jgi:hypothetical protein
MSVQIHINGENAEETIRELSVLAAHLSLPSVPVGNLVAASAEETTATKVESTKAEKPARSRSTSKQAEAVKEDQEPPSGNDQTNDSAGIEVENELAGDTGDEPVISAADLRAKATAVAQAGKQAQVKALLVEFEAANISTIPEDKRSAFYKALEALE